MPSRGFEFELDPPMNVNVLEGNILGELKEPVAGLVPKPGVLYPPEPLTNDDAAASKGEP